MSHNHQIRSQLRSLLPSTSRNASFHAQIIIHELVNVPLVSGDFAVQWRFQHARSINPGHIHVSKGKGKEEEWSSGTIEESSEQDSLKEKKGTYYSSSSSDSYSTSQFPSSSSPLANPGTYGQYLTPEPAPVADSEESIEIPDTFISSVKGRTDYSPLLHDHTVSFNQRIEMDLNLTVDKETSDLQPCELKLKILQDLPTVDGKESDRDSLGVIYINLAQYAKAGSATRRHLLQKSKVNAILKVTIELKQFAGETQFNAPPLPEGQLLSGVSGLLTREGLLQRAVKLESFHRTLSANSLTTGGSKGDSERPTYSSRISDLGHSFTQAPSPLPSATTEAIIDALFNPSHSSSSTPSPFTVPAPPRSKTPDSSPHFPGTYDRRLSAEHSISDRSSMSASLSGPSSSHEYDIPPSSRPAPVLQPEGKNQKWWKLGGRGSRPASPMSTSSNPYQQTEYRSSTPSLALGVRRRSRSSHRAEVNFRPRPPAIAVTDADEG